MAELPADRDLEVLLDYLRRSRGFDFTGYKRTSLTRRIDKRMQEVRADGYLSYLDHLEVDPEEFAQLFNTILLNVTSFFRDPPAWEYLSAEILPQLIAGQARRRAAPDLERWLRLRGGGVHAGHGRRRGPGARVGAPAGQDLRHRRRRGGAQPGPPGPLHGQAG